MKSKLLLLSFLMLFAFTTNYAQSSASVSGIAVQGIARDDNNTALINAEVRFNFRIYDKSASTDIYEDDATISTDEFGVFSHVLDIPAEKNSDFANKVLWLEIKDSAGEIISDEVFKQVPYAIAASNGVPTGSIMPFVGTDVPEGWAICDGRVLTSIDGSEALAALLPGTKLPDLRGMFLRGAETNADPQYASNVGPALNTIQGDANKEHGHGTTENNHTHGFKDIYWVERASDIPASSGISTVSVPSGLGSGDTGGSNVGWQLDKTTGNAKTNLTINNSGDATEARPVNYGVNYIIKL
jgi:microcystin-dependent protein